MNVSSSKKLQQKQLDKYYYRTSATKNADEADDEEEIIRNSKVKHSVKSRRHLDPEEYEEELLHHRAWNRYNSLPNVTNIRNSNHHDFHGNTSSTKSPLHVKTGSDGVGVYQHAKG